MESGADFEVLEWEWSAENDRIGDGYALIQNNRDSDYGLVQVSVACYDGEDIRIGEGIGVSNGLMAGGKVKIGLVLIYEDDPEYCNIEEVTGF